MLPKTGGVYVYLRAAYGDGAAFVIGWLYLLVSTPATLGALSTFFAELLTGLLGVDARTRPEWVVPVVAGATIAILSVANLLGARLGSAIQSALTVVKVGAIVAMVLTILLLAHGSFGHIAPSAWGAQNVGSGAASVIWAYDGWVAVSMIAGEIVAPEKEMKGIIITGMLIIIGLYLGANVAYFYAMPVEVMAQEVGGIPQRLMGDLLGPSARAGIGLAILCSVFGALNGNILSKPRVSYALSRDGLTFRFLGRPHPRWATPYWAIVIEALVALVLIAALRDFDALTTYFVVVEWASLLFAVGAVFVLRRRMPDATRPFRTPAYPWVPLIFIVGTFAGLVAIVSGEVARPIPNYAPLFGLLIAAAGFPVYRVWRRLLPAKGAA
jgi:amino acid transporter